MKKIILALAFLSSFMFLDAAKAISYYENIPVLGDLGVKQDLAKAFKFYKKACDGGYARGCFGLGGFYFEGKEVTKDDKKALEFFKKACDMGDKESCTLAAVMDGDNANLAKASEQHKKDCDSKGDILACGLFALFMEGKDNKEAAKYYKKACELGKNISDPALQNNPAFNDGIKQFCSRPAELEAQNLRAVQDVIKAKIAEEYRISCDSEENWVSCAIYASNRERRSKSGDAILRQGVQIGQKNHKYRF